jgi:hypothetical protein
MRRTIASDLAGDRKMKRFKIIQIYVVRAETKREAMDKWLASDASDYFETSIVKEVEESGLWAKVKQQVAG